MHSRPQKILVPGAGGLLGRHVVEEYRRRGEKVTALSHAELDVTQEDAVRMVLDREKPDVVINCAALCHFQRCEENPAASAAVNRDAPIRLAGLTAERGIRLVHFSTDYIFDGHSQVPYREEDAPNALSVYGRHKTAVEAAFPAFPTHLLLRVAWLFGQRGKTFLSLLPSLLLEKETLEVASGKRGTCLHAGYAAQIIRQLVGKGIAGRVNLVHSGETSWEGFARETLRQLHERGLEPRCREIIEVPLEKMASLRGSRPLYSVLSTEKLAISLGQTPIAWQEGLKQYLDTLFS